MNEDSERKLLRDQFDKETLAAWKDYKTTGLHSTEEEVDESIAKLEAGEDAELPECHT